MKIVILDGYSVNPGDLSWDALKQFGDLEVYPRTAANDVINRAKDADIVLTNKVGFDAGRFSQLPKLRMVNVLATGFNIIDTDAAKRSGVVVCNIPAYSTASVAQMVFAHILNITNKVDSFARQNREGRWSKCPDFCYWDAPLHELAGKTIGIVGLGHIGKRVADIAKDFGMKVVALTSKPQEALGGIRKVSLDELLSQSDVVTLHCPLTASTRNMINRESLAKMKPTAILINTGRGPLVDEQAVADALAANQLGAYGADVMTNEPPAIDNPLLSQPNAYLTPHVAWATVEARSRLIDITEANVRAFIAGSPQNVVNP